MPALQCTGIKKISISKSPAFELSKKGITYFEGTLTNGHQFFIWKKPLLGMCQG